MTGAPPLALGVINDLVAGYVTALWEVIVDVAVVGVAQIACDEEERGGCDGFVVIGFANGAL